MVDTIQHKPDVPLAMQEEPPYFDYCQLIVEIKAERLLELFQF